MGSEGTTALSYKNLSGSAKTDREKMSSFDVVISPYNLP